MAKKVKLASIATELGVSTVTVSKALSGQKGVSEEMRDKIKILADQMGYKRISAAQGTKKSGSYNIGVIVPDRYLDKYESFYWKMYQDVATIANQKECFTMLEVISMKDEKNFELPKLIKDKKADGIILIGRPVTGYIQKLRLESAVPMVCLDFFDESSKCDAVISDGFFGTYILTNYLFEMGHEDIAYVGTLLYSSSINDRYFGYCKSMLEHGKKVPEEWVIDDRDWERDVNVFKFELPDKMPTAFVCNCDLTASYLIKTLREKGYRVPEDISITGFDNYLYPGLCDIGITTYDVNIKEMARKSIHSLIKNMSGEIYKSGLNIVEGNIIYKESVKRIL